MRKRVRLATTAGVTVLGFTAMSGMAQADTGGGLGLPDLTGSLAKTGPVGKTVDGVVKQATGSSGGSGLNLNLPVNVRLGAPQSSSPAGHSGPAVKAHVKAGVKAAVGPVAARARLNVSLCAGAPRQCGERVPSPPTPIPPAPPTPPPPTPIGNQPPSAPGSGSGAEGHSASSLTVGGDSLPFTGGPIGALALLGAAAVVTGAAGVAGSRLRTNRG